MATRRDDAPRFTDNESRGASVLSGYRQTSSRITPAYLSRNLKVYEKYGLPQDLNRIARMTDTQRENAAADAVIKKFLDGRTPDKPPAGDGGGGSKPKPPGGGGNNPPSGGNRPPGGGGRPTRPKPKPPSGGNRPKPPGNGKPKPPKPPPPGSPPKKPPKKPTTGSGGGKGNNTCLLYTSPSPRD